MTKVMVIAGEASGDAHAAEVVKILKERHPDWSFSGIAGPLLREQGVEAIIESERISVMGFVEVLSHIKTIFSAFKKIKSAILKDKPELIILVDYPGFNLRMAAFAKKQGIKVLYYVSPQIWAWKKGRIKKIKACVDHMALILPFELPIYQKAGIPATYVGSPLAEELDPHLTQSQARKEFGLNSETPVLVLLPGSRMIEIKRMLPVMLETALILKNRYKNLEFLLPMARTINQKIFEDYIRLYDLPIQLIQNRTHEAIAAGDLALCASGTVTLETALLGTPMVIIYKMQELSFQIIKRLIKIKFIGLCNIVAQKSIAPELIQHQATPKNIAAELSALLDDEHKRHKQKQAFLLIKEQFKNSQAAVKVAGIAESLIIPLDAS